MVNNSENGVSNYKGSCLCGEITYTAKGKPINPHLCSCSMCQKSSGAPTVAWVSFALNTFEWDGISLPNKYQSSSTVQRFFCKQCGCLFAALDEGNDNICITIASLNNPNLIVPVSQHSFKENAPLWWSPQILGE